MTSTDTTNYDMGAFSDRKVWRASDVGISVNVSYIMKVAWSSVCKMRLTQDVVVSLSLIPCYLWVVELIQTSTDHPRISTGTPLCSVKLFRDCNEFFIFPSFNHSCYISRASFDILDISSRTSYISQSSNSKCGNIPTITRGVWCACVLLWMLLGWLSYSVISE